MDGGGGGGGFYRLVYICHINIYIPDGPWQINQQQEVKSSLIGMLMYILISGSVTWQQHLQ